MYHVSPHSDVCVGTQRNIVIGKATIAEPRSPIHPVALHRQELQVGRNPHPPRLTSALEMLSQLGSHMLRGGVTSLFWRKCVAPCPHVIPLTDSELSPASLPDWVNPRLLCGFEICHSNHVIEGRCTFRSPEVNVSIRGPDGPACTRLIIASAPIAGSHQSHNLRVDVSGTP